MHVRVPGVTVALRKCASKYIYFYIQNLLIGPTDAPQNYIQSVLKIESHTKCF
jgi:hypothetical protein